jgi:Na+:H+ antiporter, NhaA family
VDDRKRPRGFEMMREFLRNESSSGFVLIAASVVGLIFANSPMRQSFADLLHLKLGFETAFFGLQLTAHDWVNEGLMAAFFMLVTLEIRREVIDGELSTLDRAALPVIAAFGGIMFPALICAAFLRHDPATLRGWAIPTATDIAFALAALSLVGRGVPPTIKIFLTALAVIDDLAAIAIVAVFYTASLALPALLLALAAFAAVLLLNRLRVTWLPIYFAIGIVMWFCVFESGVHATVAGVALALALPAGAIEKIEHAVHPYVAFAIVPIFGLFNAGVSFAGLTSSALLGSVPVGIAAALFFGKQIGIFSFSWIAVKSGIASLPHGANWRLMYGVALLGGIGFTMSLFIATLAFNSDALLIQAKIGVFTGSALSACAAYLVLRGAGTRKRALSSSATEPAR